MIQGATLKELRRDKEKNKMKYSDLSEEDKKKRAKKIKLLNRPTLAELMRVGNRTKMLIEMEFEP
jgi:hypothetical protein